MSGSERAVIRTVFYTDSDLVGGCEKSLATLVGSLSDEFDVTVVGVCRNVIDAVASTRPGAATRLLPRVKAPWGARGVASHFLALRELRPQIFQAQQSSPWACEYGVLAAVATRRTRVVTVIQCPSPATVGRERTLFKLLARQVDAYVAPGRRAAREVEAVTGLKRGSVTVIHNGVDEVRRSASQRPADGPVVGWVGRLAREKGVDVLLAALVELPGVTALLVGDGPERAPLEALASRLGIDDRVVFAGWQDEPQAFLGTFDVFAFPSRIEAFPLAVLEAMLAELPVIASDVGSVEEVVVPGETGILVPPDDPTLLAAAIRRLLENDNERRELARRGRALVLERFSASAMAQGYEDLYRRLLAS